MVIELIVIITLMYPVLRAPESSKLLSQIIDVGTTFGVGILGFLIT